LDDLGLEPTDFYVMSIRYVVQFFLFPTDRKFLFSSFHYTTLVIGKCYSCV